MRTGECTHIQIVVPKRVYHVGTLDANAKRQARSFEGNCLSVSVCPDAWGRIAQIGGQTWELSKPEGQFLDAFALSGHASRRIVNECSDFGLLTKVTAFSVQREDEDGEQQSLFFLDRQEALGEADEDAAPAAFETIASTPALETEFDLKETAIASFAYDFALLAWARRAGLDGVWWRETFDPARLSAPRGAIFAERVESWRRDPIQHLPDDETLMARFPGAKRIALVATDIPKSRAR